MKPEFHQTVNVLVQAYLNDTLFHGNDCACAVGNLICHANGYDVNNWSPKWHLAFRCTTYLAFKEEGLAEVKSTGYTVDEILQIERAFEGADGDWCNHDAWVFNGLMAVVDVLAEIHNVDLSVREDAKLLFAKPETKNQPQYEIN